MRKFLFVLNDFLIDPLGIGYLSSALKAAGHQTDIIKTKKESIWKKIEEYAPDIVAFSTTTGWHKYYISLAQNIKKKYPSIVTLFGGAHATFFPEMVEEEGVDAICRGEGEKAIVAFANAVENGYWNKFPISNVWTKSHKSDTFFPLEPVDSILFPDRELIYKYPENRDNPIKNMMCSRGCLFKCSYCFNKAMYGLYPDWGVRRRSPYLIAKEAIELKNNYPVDLIFFQDDIFVTNLNWLEEFVNIWNIDARIPFHAQLRYDITKKDTIRLLKEGGCESVTFAVETANPKLGKEMLHRTVNPQRLKKIIEWCHQYSLKVRLECMVGLPTERIEDSLDTLDLVRESEPDMSWCSIYQPYPRTELGEQAIKAGLFSGDVNKMPQDFFSKSLLNKSDKHLFENLQKLFAIGVAYPQTQAFIKKLIQFPPNPVFSKIYQAFKKYKYSKLYGTK